MDLVMPVQQRSIAIGRAYEYSTPIGTENPATYYIFKRKNCTNKNRKQNNRY